MTRTHRQDLHNEWLSLVDIDGPFLSAPVAREVWGDRLPHDRELRNTVLDLTSDAIADDWASRQSWLETLLNDLLQHRTDGSKATLDLQPELTHTFDTHTGPVTLRPWATLHQPGKRDDIRAVVLATPGADLPDNPDRYAPGRRHAADGWAATPVQRATRLARATGSRLAVVTNGAAITIVTIHDTVVGHGTWNVNLFQPEPVHLDSLVALLHVNRLYGPKDDQPEQLFERSRDAQRDLTDDLGANVKKSAELLVAALSRANTRHNHQLLADVPPHQMYQATVTVLMRLVFLLTAEERGLLPSDNDLYRTSYAASTLRNDLEQGLRTGRATLQRRSSGWHRLLALSRAVHQGVEHPDLRIAGYGGDLFDPDRYPFLEGLTLNDPDADLVDDLTLHDILQAITVIDGQPISFRALDVEQIGHVYESLLDHSAVPTDQPVLGLVSAHRGQEPEVPLADLEAADLTSRDSLVKLLAERTDRPPKWVKQQLDSDLEDTVQRGLLTACGGDQHLAARVAPYGNVLRLDLRSIPLVFNPGDIYVTKTSAKRDSGTAYTTRKLADEVAVHTLEPLVYAPGPQNTEDRDQWQLKPSTDILNLKVCDPAIGSGAIAVAAVRFLADRLVDAWLNEGTVTDADLVASSEDSDQLDVAVRARREIVARCIYGVDRDPMAVEMAKMSLWLVTMAKDRPFTFLDHAIKCGDSLLGITSLEQLQYLHLDVEQGKKLHQQAVIPLNDDLAVAAEQTGLFEADSEQQSFDYGHYSTAIGPVIDGAREARHRVRAGDVVDLSDANARALDAADADDLIATLRVVADAVVAACLSTANQSQARTKERLKRIAAVLPSVVSSADSEALGELGALAAGWREEGNPSDSPRRFLHWPLEFPEVFDEAGFDAMLGNPPFIGRRNLSGAIGVDQREHLMRYVCAGARGTSTDLVAMFLRRVAGLAKGFGMLATSGVAGGDNKRVAMIPLASMGTFYRGDGPLPWPGTAQVHIVKLWWTSGGWDAPRVLNDVPVDGIEPDLFPSGRVGGEPYPLSGRPMASLGQIARRMAGVVPAEEARELIRRDPRNGEVLSPYLNTKDMHASPTQEASRYIVNFRQMSIEQARSYPDCFSIVDEDLEGGALATGAYAGGNWWQFLSYLPDLVEKMSELREVIAVGAVSTYAVPLRVSPDQVISNSIAIVCSEDDDVLGLLTSSVHNVWLARYGTAMKSDFRYGVNNVYKTFPWPQTDLSAVGEAIAAVDAYRRQLMVSRNIGLLKVYQRFHDPHCNEEEVRQLRDHHIDLDAAVLHAYGWHDLDLHHGFRGTRHGHFFTVSLESRYELLARLLELNFEQYARQTGRSYSEVLREARIHGRS